MGPSVKNLVQLRVAQLPRLQHSYQELLEKGIKEFFPSSDNQRYKYFLADAQGIKLPDDINGATWTLDEYLCSHGLFPSKTKLYCVQVRFMN